MTEQEWLTCTDPTPMLEFLRDKATERKLRLFAVACCHRIWRLLPDERSRKLVTTLEAYADRGATWEDCEVAAGVHGSEPLMDHSEPDRAAAQDAARAAGWYDAHLAATDAARHAAWATVEETALIDPNVYAVATALPEHAIQVALLRDIFCNPFRRAKVDPAWLTSTVVALATGIYEERAFDRMPILADALQDAGCDNEDILNHCRSEGPHVRGCWVVDLLLDKS